MVISAINGSNLNEKVKTSIIAQRYCVVAKKWLNSDGRKYFDEKAFNFRLFSGTRADYLPFNICLKILANYGYIRYYKEGSVERLKDNFEIKTEFT